MRTSHHFPNITVDQVIDLRLCQVTQLNESVEQCTLRGRQALQIVQTLMTSAYVSGIFQVSLQLLFVQINHSYTIAMQVEQERDALHAGQSRCHA